jgi:hypothetical protein
VPSLAVAPAGYADLRRPVPACGFVALLVDPNSIAITVSRRRSLSAFA